MTATPNTLAVCYMMQAIGCARTVMGIYRDRTLCATVDEVRRDEACSGMDRLLPIFSAGVESCIPKCAAFIELLDSGAMKVLPEPLWLELRRRLRHMRNPQLPLIALWVRNPDLAFLKNTKDDVRRALDGFVETVAWIEKPPKALKKLIRIADKELLEFGGQP